MIDDEPLDPLDRGIRALNALLEELAAEPIAPLVDDAPAPRWPRCEQP